MFNPGSDTEQQRSFEVIYVDTNIREEKTASTSSCLGEERGDVPSYLSFDLLRIFL